MASVEDVARRVLAAIATDANLPLVAQWVADRYRRVAARKRFRHLRRLVEISAPADTASGTMSAVRGSRVVNMDDTASLAVSVDPGGQHVRFKVAWYEIEGRVGDLLTLKSPYGEDTGTDLAYHVVSRVLPLPRDARWVGETFVSMRRRWPIHKVPLETLDRLAPARSSIGAGARIFAEIGRITDDEDRDVVGLEFYPYADDTETYHGVVYAIPDEMTMQTQIPATIDPHVLVEGTLIDAMRYNMVQALKPGGSVEAAALWRNEYRAQETRWESVILDAFRADVSVDEVTFILAELGEYELRGDIRDAHDMVWDRWPR